ISWLPAFATYTHPSGRGNRPRTRNSGDEPVASRVYENAESRSGLRASGQSSMKIESCPTTDTVTFESPLCESDLQLIPTKVETTIAVNNDTVRRSPPSGVTR